MNFNELDKNICFGILAQAISIIGTVFIAGSLSCRGADAADLAPTQSFVLGRVVGDSVFSADLQWLAAGQQDGTVAVWNVGKGERAGNWSGGSNLAFLPRSVELLVASGTNITVRELLTGRIVRRLESPSHTITSLTISPAGNVAVGTIDTSTASTMGTVYKSEFIFWNLAEGRINRKMPTARYPWEGVMPYSRSFGSLSGLPISVRVGFCRAFSPEGGRFAVGLNSSTPINLWNLGGTNYSHYLGGLSDPSYGSSIIGHANEIAFLDRQRLAVVYNQEQLCVHTLKPSDAEILQGLPRVSFQATKPTGEVVTGEVVADALDRAGTQIRQLGLTPTALKSLSDGEPGQPGPILNDKAQQASRSRILNTQVLIGGPELQIRSLALSGDGRCLAVAGMRMDKRPGTFGGTMYGSFVYDAPKYGEVQVWDAVTMKVLATIKGKPDEKFSLVALDEIGRRVAAVTDGVEYNRGMIGAMQQTAELGPARARRVYVWELPREKPVAKPEK